MLGINEQSAKDLAKLLRTSEIQVRNVRKGDVIWDDYNLWVVVGREVHRDGSITLKEADDNDCIYPLYLIKEKIRIIERKTLKRK